MNIRDRAYFATSALIYSGALYAGISGYGLNVVPLFASIFMLWLFVVRPNDWPQTAEAWRTPRAIAWPLLIFSAQFIVAGFCLVVGTGIGGILGFQMPLPLTFCILVSLLGVALARFLQPEDAAHIRRAPGHELGIGAGILDIGVPQMPGQPAEAAYIDSVMMHLSDFGQKRAPREDVAQMVMAVEKADMARPVLNALIASRSDILAQKQMQSMLALRPSVAKSVKGEGLVGKAVTHALSTWVPQVIEDTAKDAKALLKKFPAVAEELPSPVRLEAAAKSLGAQNPSAAEALRALSNSLGRVTSKPSHA